MSSIKSEGFIKKLFLSPGRMYQWLVYMFSKERNADRLAASSFLTYVFSLIFWGFLIWFLVDINY